VRNYESARVGKAFVAANMIEMEMGAYRKPHFSSAETRQLVRQDYSLTRTSTIDHQQASGANYSYHVAAEAR
jgi:hypothetical protein